jgi:hypothetical protein
MHAVPFDFELTRQVGSVVKLDIVLPKSLLDLQPHPAYDWAELTPQRVPEHFRHAGYLSTRCSLVRSGTTDLTSRAVPDCAEVLR